MEGHVSRTPFLYGVSFLYSALAVCRTDEMKCGLCRAHDFHYVWLLALLDVMVAFVKLAFLIWLLVFHRSYIHSVKDCASFGALFRLTPQFARHCKKI